MTDPRTPILPVEVDQDRVQHSAMRRRTLEGEHADDALTEVKQFFHPAVVAQMGGKFALDLSLNLPDQVCDELAVSYVVPPAVEHDDLPNERMLVQDNDGDDQVEMVEAPELAEFKERLEEAGLWQIQQGTERFLHGVREALVRVDWVPELGQLRYMPVAMDQVALFAPANDPDMPNRVVHARLRRVRDEVCWTWDDWDVSGKEPRYRVLLPGDSRKLAEAEDITTEIFEGQTFEGNAYPVWLEDRPWLPYVLFHARRTGKLTDHFRYRRLFEGSLRATAFMTFFGANMRDSSHQQRVMIDLDAPGGQVVGQGTNAAHIQVPLSPNTIQSLVSLDPNRPGRIDQWLQSVKPSEIIEAIVAYVEMLLASMKIEAAVGVDRSGGPESGWAISIKRGSIREKQSEIRPNLRRGDEQLLAISAALLNRHVDGSNLPESGWSVTHDELPLTPAEAKGRADEAISDMELGIASPVDLVLARNPSWSRKQAVQHLKDVRRENTQFSDFGRSRSTR